MVLYWLFIKLFISLSLCSGRLTVSVMWMKVWKYVYFNVYESLSLCAGYWQLVSSGHCHWWWCTCLCNLYDLSHCHWTNSYYSLLLLLLLLLWLANHPESTSSTTPLEVTLRWQNHQQVFMLWVMLWVMIMTATASQVSKWHYHWGACAAECDWAQNWMAAVQNREGPHVSNQLDASTHECVQSIWEASCALANTHFFDHPIHHPGESRFVILWHWYWFDLIRADHSSVRIQVFQVSVSGQDFLRFWLWWFPLTSSKHQYAFLLYWLRPTVSGWY